MCLIYIKSERMGLKMGLAQLKENESCEICAKTARKEAVNDMKKNLIMDAAQRVIARDGFVSARLENIAEEAGFSKASIYHYFADKEALLAHMVIRELRADYYKCLEATEKNLPFVEYVKVFVSTFFDNEVLESGEAYMLDIATAMVTTSKHADLMHEVRDYKLGAYELMKQAVRRARENGEIEIPVEDRAVAAMIISFVNTTVIMRSFVVSLNNSPKETRVTDVELSDSYMPPTFDWIYNSIMALLKPWIKEA